MLVLVTRPAAQAAATADALAAMGHEPLVDPLLAVEPLPVAAPDPAGLAALVLTSANAARLLPPGLAGLPAYAVGAATAAAARRVGAREVREAGDGDGHTLGAAIARDLPPGSVVLHLAGEDVRPGLEEALREAGLGYRRLVAYRTAPSAGLAVPTRAALEAGRLGAVLLFSPRTAEVWAGHVRAAGLGAALQHVLGCCISAAAAGPVARLPWRDLRIADAPGRAALLRCLDAP